MKMRHLIAFCIVVCAASGALAVLGENERQVGLDNVCRKSGNEGDMCNPLNDDADCPGGTCAPALVPAGKPNKFKGTVTIITDEDLSAFDLAHETPPHRATTLILQLKGRFGDVKDPILAQTYQTTGAADTLPLFPDNVEPFATSNAGAENTLGDLFDFGDDAALRLRTLDCDMTYKLRGLLGLSTGTPVVVKAQKRSFNDQRELTAQPGMASVLVVDINGMVVDLKADPC
jgi:hypothetical protein